MNVIEAYYTLLLTLLLLLKADNISLLSLHNSQVPFSSMAAVVTIQSLIKLSSLM